MDASERRALATQEAATWWVAFEAGEMTRAEREAFVDWLRESAIHVAEMLRIADVHGALEQFQEWTTIPADESAAQPSHAANVVALKDVAIGHARRSRTLMRRVLPFAAAIAAVGTGLVLLALRLNGQSIETERGERREVALADGSVVEVAPETRLRVKFEPNQRRVILETGRALFRAAKNAQRPFVVQSEDTLVWAIGTAFGVERRDQSLVVTVAEGKVAVLRNGDAGEPLVTEPGGIAPLLAAIEVSAGEQVAVPRSGSARPVRKVDSGRELAWADGRLVFENTAVSKVIEEFNRFNRVQLHVTDDTLAHRPMSGVFDAADPESFIAFVQTLSTVRVVRDDTQNITLAPAVRRSPTVTNN